jgi:hypothetical protein
MNNQRFVYSFAYLFVDAVVETQRAPSALWLVHFYFCIVPVKAIDLLAKHMVLVRASLYL